MKPDRRLVLVCGLPGTGKTTLSRSLTVALDATYLRVDAAETAVEEVTGEPAGVVGYAVVWQLARANLLLGRPVVIDAVCPVPAARSGWRELAAETDASLLVVETRLADREEHRRRIERRRPDMVGQRVPTWTDVLRLEYVPWDEERDGRRTVVDTGSASDALVAALAAPPAQSAARNP